MSHSLDHMGFYVHDLPKAKAFYLSALAPLGITLIHEFEQGLGFGREGKADFWIIKGGPAPGAESVTKLGLHLCFTARSRSDVEAFYAAAIAAGGKDNGPPGIRTEYHPNYYGAFVFDLDGHNIEAVRHDPE